MGDALCYPPLLLWLGGRVHAPNVWGGVARRGEAGPWDILFRSLTGVPAAAVLGGAQAAMEDGPRGPAPAGLHPDGAGAGRRLPVPPPLQDPQPLLPAQLAGHRHCFPFRLPGAFSPLGSRSRLAAVGSTQGFPCTHTTRSLCLAPGDGSSGRIPERRQLKCRRRLLVPTLVCSALTQCAAHLSSLRSPSHSTRHANSRSSFPPSPFPLFFEPEAILEVATF